MGNSPLVNFTLLSPNCNKPRNKAIKKITIHHVAGVTSVETLGSLFANPARQGSSNYGIGNDGRIGLFVEEKDRAWTSSSADNDHQAITIEVSNSSSGGNWPVSDKAMASLINLCADICKRNGIERLIFTGDAKGNITQHNYFAATACPGPYLKSKFPYIVEEVNRRLEVIAHPSQPEPFAKPFLVRVTVMALSIRKGPGNDYPPVGTIADKGVYTIVQEIDGWGRLKSGAGWISLYFTKKL